MFTIWHLPYAKVIREMQEEKEAMTYCKFLNLALYSRAEISEGSPRFVVSAKIAEIAGIKESV